MNQQAQGGMTAAESGLLAQRMSAAGGQGGIAGICGMFSMLMGVHVNTREAFQLVSALGAGGLENLSATFLTDSPGFANWLSEMLFQKGVSVEELVGAAQMLEAQPIQAPVESVSPLGLPSIRGSGIEPSMN